MNESFGLEARFVGYSDSSRSGPRITFSIADRADLEKFVGCEGKRYMLAGQQISDDETPAVEQPAPKPEKLGPMAMLAVRWCKDVAFQNWIGADSEAGAKARVLCLCGVQSRRDIDSDKYAPSRFTVLIRKPFAEHLTSLGRQEVT